jgi:hypothetical protein
LPIAFDSARSRPGGQNLTEVLAKGPLPLEAALRYATEIATVLREMHLDGRAHGSVEPQNVYLKSSGATLAPPDRRGYTDPLNDLAGFGMVLYAMLTGRAPAGEELRLVPAKPPVVKGPAAVRAAATRLAERCLTAERETAPDMQKVLTEARLLHVMSKQFQPDAQGLFAVPAPAPPAFPAGQTLEVYAGKAPPIINPPAGTPETASTLETDPVPPEAVLLDPPVADEEEQGTEPPAARPGEHSPPTVRARGSHSRPVLKDVMCPKCKGYHVRLSRPRTRFERLLNLMGIGVHRCHRCFYRYIPLLGRKIVRKAK